MAGEYHGDANSKTFYIESYESIWYLENSHGATKNRHFGTKLSPIQGFLANSRQRKKKKLLEAENKIDKHTFPILNCDSMDLKQKRLNVRVGKNWNFQFFTTVNLHQNEQRYVKVDDKIYLNFRNVL